MHTLPLLGIRHWSVDVHIVEAPDGNDGSAACVHNMSDYDHAMMEFKREFIEEQETWEEIDKVIIHELLHMVFRDYDEAIAQVNSHLNVPVKQIWQQGVEHELEGVIQRLALQLYAAYGS